MFLRHDEVLGTNLVQNGTKILTGDYDEFRLSPNAHVITVDDTRYVAPTDFIVTSDGSGDLTVTWLSATTIPSGKTLRAGIAYIDFIVGGSAATTTGGGGTGTADSTAANQVVGNNILSNILAKTPAFGTAGTAAADVITVQGIAGAVAVKVDGSAVTQPVSSATLATAANQTTANTSLASIVTNTTGGATAANQATANTSLASIVTNTSANATATNQTALIGTKAPGVAAASSILTGGVFSSTPPSVLNGQQVALQVDSSGRQIMVAPLSDTKLDTLHTDFTGLATVAKQPALGVAGTASADVITVQGIAGGVAQKVDGSAVTQPISGSLVNISGTISLPTGAATAAKQPALGTAGTSSADVLTVQGRAAMTPLLVDGSATTQPVSSATLATAAAQTTAQTSLGSIVTNTAASSTAANQTAVTGSKAAGTAAASSILVGGVFNTTLPTLTTGQQAAIQSDASGRVIIAAPLSDTKLDTLHTDLGSMATAAAQTTGNGFLSTLATNSSTIITNTASGKYAEDNAHVNADLGVFVLAVRQDTAASTAGTSGDYTALTTDAVGRTWTHPNAAANDFADGWDATQGGKADTAATTDTGTFSLIALTKRLLQSVNAATAPSYTNLVNGKTAAMTTTGTTAVTGMGAPAAATYNYISAVIVSNAHATVGTNVRLQDGNGGTAFGPSFPAAPAYGGVAVSFNPPLKQPTAATALYAVCSVTGANVELSVVGYTGA